MATPELKIRLLLVSEQFTEQMQEASAATSALERSCEGAGAAASGCAQAIDKSAAAAKDASAETTKMASAFDRAQGGVDVLSGSAEIASGSISGLAGGALQTAEGLKKMGFSLAEIRPRLLALAAAASVAALVAKLLQDMAAKAALLDKVRLDNITSGARRLSEEFSRASAAMERAGALTDALGAAREEGAETLHRTRLLRLEAGRDRELAAARASGGDEQAILARYDAQRRALEIGRERERVFARTGAIDGALGRNRERQGAISAQMDALIGQFRALTGAAQGYREQADGAILTATRERYTKLFEDASARAADVSAEVERLGEEMKDLRAASQALSAQLAAERLRVGEVNAREEAGRAAARLAGMAAPERASGVLAAEEEERAAGRGSGVAGQVAMLGDRLARIGGYIGSGYSTANEARAQLSEAKKASQLLASIDRKIGSSFGNGLAVLA